MAVMEHPAASERQSTIDAKAQAHIQGLLDELTSSGLETGVQVAAFLNGELVIDAWSGKANPETGEAVKSDTLFIAFSCSKGVTSTVIHQLVEAGNLDYEKPIADYWPEFAKNGKDKITLRHVLLHQAGIPQTPKGWTIDKLPDWEFMVHGVENLKPLWKAGTRTAYHAMTFGVILGEVARRADGRPFAQIVQENICQPLGITDLFFGTPAAVEDRIAKIGGSRLPLMILPPLPFILIKRAIPPALEPNERWNCPSLYRAVLPAGNMITTARSLAKHYAALMDNGVEGVRLLPPERVKIATAFASDARDWLFLGARIQRGLGYWLGGNEGSVFGLRRSVFGHTGSGGSLAFADPDYHFSFALLKNEQTWREDNTDRKMAHAVREALDLPD